MSGYAKYADEFETRRPRTAAATSLLCCPSPRTCLCHCFISCAFWSGLTLVFLLSRWLVNPNMMSESTKIVPRSMTLGLGFSSPEDPDEFGKDMWAVRKMLHSSGHLLDLYIHVIYVSPRGGLIRTSSGLRRALARVRKTASQLSRGPKRLSGDHIHPCAQTLFMSTWTLRTTPEGGVGGWGGCCC